MNERDENLTGHDSLAIIQQMIYAAKQDQKDDGIGWILWGWLLFAASVLTIVNLQYNWYSTFFFWNVFGIIAIGLLLFTIVKALVFKRTKKVRTYTKDVFDKLNIGFTISLLLIIVAMNVYITPSIGFALLTGLYAFWIMIYGALLNFKPSNIAAYFVFALALACMFVPNFKLVMVIHAVAVLIGYIIPGYMANRAFKQISKASFNTTA